MRACQRSLSTSISGPSAPVAGFDWSKLKFALTRTDFMYVSETSLGSSFSKGQLKPYGAIALEPAATVLNYGQGLFEGLKALRSSSGRCVLFRPEKNAERAAAGCDRLLMPKISSEVFLDGVIQTARANSHWIPPNGQGSLYLRPIIFGSGAGLGVAASEWFHFVVFASPVGSYFKSGAGSGVALEVSETFHRAAPKGVGNVKSISNYAPAYQAQAAAKKRGFSDALFLDTTDTNVEEAGAANFFVVDKSGVVRTPSLGSILPGVTRDAVLTLARDLGFKVREGPLPIAEVMEAQEAWCTGTAAVISPVASVTYKGNKKEFAAPNVSKKIHKLFDDILEGREKDTHKWIVNLF